VDDKGSHHVAAGPVVQGTTLRQARPCIDGLTRFCFLLLSFVCLFCWGVPRQGARFRTRTNPGGGAPELVHSPTNPPVRPRTPPNMPNLFFYPIRQVVTRSCAPEGQMLSWTAGTVAQADAVTPT